LRKDSNPTNDDGTGATILRQYDLHYAFPTSISQIDLAYDSNDQIEEFTVEFQYSYWTATSGEKAFSSDVKGWFSDLINSIIR